MSKSTIKSMTAFVQHHGKGDWVSAIWEIRSVNNRYYDQTIRLTDDLRELEPDIREISKRYIHRGKIECQLRLKCSETAGELTIDDARLKAIYSASQQIANTLHDILPLRLIDILKWPGIVTMDQLNIQVLKPSLILLYEEALQKLIEAREREGLAIKEILMTKLSRIQQIIDKITEHQPMILQLQREQLLQRLSEIKVQYDPQRFEEEMVYLAQKSDVMEELERLKTHLHEVRRIIEKGGVVGRQLDFFMQELNREANTLGSKSVNAEVTQAVVELKILIEQMREQIQNIE